MVVLTKKHIIMKKIYTLLIAAGIISSCSTSSDVVSNSFIQKRVEKEKKFPLRVKLCLDCALSQLDTVVSHKFIFSDYMYLSSSSKALVNHYKKMILKIKKEYELKKKDLILDIGCNDGIILDCYGINYTKIN